MPPPALTQRILSRLERAEWHEANPHLQADYRIAWITVLCASRGELLPHVRATYAVLGLHPSKVWPAILERRKALLGSVLWETELPPRKAVRSVRELPQRADRTA